MVKRVFLLPIFLLFFIIGCAERGYQISKNVATQTITTEMSTDIKTHPKTKKQLKRMQKAIKKERKKEQILKAKKKAKKIKIAKKKALKTTSKNKKIKNKKEKKQLVKKAENTTIDFKTRKPNKEDKAKQKAKAKKIKLQKARALELKKSEKKKDLNTYTEPLKFQLIDKTYRKFGTSEIHGHVTYLTSAGAEIRLENTKIYILPVTKTLNDWYYNYYLKNRSKTTLHGTDVKYLNSTYLDIKRNFDFFGVVEGTYYLVIESDYPEYIAKNKKVYIAKKITVGKYKNIMAVFSKKL